MYITKQKHTDLKNKLMVTSREKVKTGVWD